MTDSHSAIQIPVSRLVGLAAAAWTYGNMSQFSVYASILKYYTDIDLQICVAPQWARNLFDKTRDELAQEMEDNGYTFGCGGWVFGEQEETDEPIDAQAMNWRLEGWTDDAKPL